MKTNQSGLNRRQFIAASGLALASLKFSKLGWAEQKKEKLIGYSDSHAHLDSFPEEDLKKLLVKMKEKNVTLVLNESINLLTSAESIRIAQANEGVYAAIGIHPGEAIPLTAEVKKKLEELSGQKKVVGFGEIGLMTGNDEEQKKLLEYQVSLARNLDYMLDIHCGTDAYRSCISMVKGTRGIIHGFTGTMDDLKAWLEIGYYISLGQVRSGSTGAGPAGMPQRQSLSEDVICAIPADRLITETDCMAGANSRWDKLGKKPMGGQGGATGGMPGNAPGSGQGGTPDGRSGGTPGGAMPAMEESNGPADVVKAAESIANVRGVSAEEIGDIATKNLKRVLKLS
jgi:TatD DNase family protein